MLLGTCVSNALTGGYYNDSEAAYIADMVENLLRTYPSDLQETDIAVVASYQDQVKFFTFLKNFGNVFQQFF